MLRLVIDTNWYVSATIIRSSRRTLYKHILRRPDLRIFYSPELLTEYDVVINRPKFRRYVTLPQAERLKGFILARIERVMAAPVRGIVADAKDDFLLGISQTCQADYLITGDPHLLALKQFGVTQIITMREFIDHHSTF